MIKLAIFDLDGTLINSLFDLGDSVNQTLEAHGYAKHSYNEYRFFVGNGTRLLINRALPEKVRGTELEEQIHSEFSALYAKNYLSKTKVYDNLEEELQKLKSDGIRLAVATNKPDRFAKEIIKALFGDDFFDVVCGSTDDIARKPQPDILLKIMNTLGTSPNETVMVGDSDVDIITSKNAHTHSIGCLWGFRGKDELEKAGADVVVNVPSELSEVMKAFSV